MIVPRLGYYHDSWVLVPLVLNMIEFGVELVHCTIELMGHSLGKQHMEHVGRLFGIQ